MKVITTDKGQWLFAEINGMFAVTGQSSFEMFKKAYEMEIVPIKSDLEFFATSAGITEEQAIQIVELYKDKGYAYYENGAPLDKYYCESVFYSFRSLLRANSLTGSNYAIIQVHP